MRNWMLWVLLTAMLTGCTVAKNEIQRATSPDGGVDAVVVEANGGATTAFAYAIFLVPKGAEPGADSVASFYRLFAEDAQPIRLVAWRDRHSLEIRFDGATQGNLDRPSVVVAGRTITIACIGTIAEPDDDNRCAPNMVELGATNGD